MSSAEGRPHAAVRPCGSVLLGGVSFRPGWRRGSELRNRARDGRIDLERSSPAAPRRGSGVRAVPNGHMWTQRAAQSRWTPVVAAMLVCTSGCEGEVTSPAVAQAPASGSSRVLNNDPEPNTVALKSIRRGCNEPIVRIAYRHPRAEVDSVREVVRSFVRFHPEFATPEVAYAEGELSGVLMARCADAQTANRLARRLSDEARELAAVPVCGYAMSGWLLARRTVPMP